MRLIDADALVDNIKLDAEKAIKEDDKVGSFWLGYFAGSVIKQPTIQSELDLKTLIRTIEMGITATNTNDAYSLGMRNGMRWCKSLIDGVEPKFEDVVADAKGLPTIQPVATDTISRQEAIDALNEYFARIGKLKRRGLTKGEEAISLDTVGAIKTLPPAQPSTSDTISRQDAIEKVDSETVSTNPEHFKSNEKFIKFMDDADIASFGKWQWANGFNTALVATKVQLEKLPTAQPEPHEGHWIWVAGDLECSKCHTRYPDLYPDYDNSVACPHCGAKMTIPTK